jgi:hypothetical protein
VTSGIWIRCGKDCENPRITRQFRSELFKITNHSNLSFPNPVVRNEAGFTIAVSTSSVTAGVIAATSPTSRKIHFVLKSSSGDTEPKALQSGATGSVTKRVGIAKPALEVFWSTLRASSSL